jgi:hypothetical protein
MCLLPVLLLRSSSASDCGEQGLERGWGSDWVRIGSGYFESYELSGTQVMALRGAFIADESGTHTFRVWAHTTGSSGDAYRNAIFLIDGGDAGHRQTEYDRSEDLTKDFRYSFRLTVTDDYYYIALSLYVASPSYPLHGLDQPGGRIETCTVSGCRNTDLTRDPYACQPSPSSAMSRTDHFSPTSLSASAPPPASSGLPASPAAATGYPDATPLASGASDPATDAAALSPSSATPSLAFTAPAWQPSRRYRLHMFWGFVFACSL